MCLINFHYHNHPNYKLIVAANRDEFYERPTAMAHFWEDYPQLLAGRDLEKQGTWLGITKQGRFAALTNYRSPVHMQRKENSRGKIVSGYLTGHTSPKDYIEGINKNNNLYSGFNLLIGNPNQLIYYNNIENSSYEVRPGTHGLSNHFLNTPWPKVVNGKNLLHHYVTTHETLQPEVLFNLLANDDVAEDVNLPHTGIGLELERQLSSLFINTADYGTRCSTVLLVTKHDDVIFIERTFYEGKFVDDRQFKFRIQPPLD
ncbi:NRDE family protein [Sporosarcina ureilytica]|uniref:NRDE family protein n=1 Tax=Sporosarcina ureilytica TaxID=298596 RepID=A0A1D8JG31_9BACL|nr:NRDE family protein [Sporosarcina ureilytica]AOV07668.1 hypothetical protein BI350_09060 [Sporosarcina ureilytica]